MEEKKRTLDGALDGFSSEARRSGVSEALVTYARAAAERKFRSAEPDPAAADRARAYAHGVVRRRSVREPDSRDLAARYTLWSIARDLRDSGREGEEICEKLDREWGAAMPEGLLCELRERLCA